MRSHVHITLIILAVTFIYLPIAGHQLHTDDFTRISDNAVLGSDYLRALFLDNKTDGFYRPINHLSFGLTYRIFGLNPFAYGLFNFVLLALTCVVVFHIINRLVRDQGLATLVLIAWLANVKVISATIVWAVGRTSGLEMLFASCAVLLVLKADQSQRRWPIFAALVFMALALFSKEGAVVVGPLLLTTSLFSAYQSRRLNTKNLVLLLCGLLVVYLSYFILRYTSGAMTPESAPDYYRWRLSAGFLLGNLGSYVERSLQFSIVLPVLVWFLAPAVGNSRSEIKNRAKWAAVFLTLFAFAISPALPVPTRSNLYPYLPSIFLVGAMAAMMGYTTKAPQFGLTNSRLIMTVSLLVLIAAPTSWIRGYNAYVRHGHTLAWVDSIEQEYTKYRPTSVCIEYEPMQNKPDGLDPMEIHFLRMALKLKNLDVDVNFTDNCEHSDGIVFRLEQRNSMYLQGHLVERPP